MSNLPHLPQSAGLRAAVLRLQAAIKSLSDLRTRAREIQGALERIRHEGKESSRRFERYAALLSGDSRIDETLPDWAQALLNAQNASETRAACLLARQAFGITQEAAILLVDEIAAQALSEIKGLGAAGAGYFAEAGAGAGSKRNQLSFEEWSGLVDLENALSALSDSQAAMRRLVPSLAAPGLVSPAQRAQSIGGPR